MGYAMSTIGIAVIAYLNIPISHLYRKHIFSVRLEMTTPSVYISGMECHLSYKKPEQRQEERSAVRRLVGPLSLGKTEV